MRPHLEALRDRLTTLFPAYVVDVPPGATFPRYLVWASGGDPATEVAVTARRDALSVLVGLTASGLTWESAATLLTRAREELCPDGYPGQLTVTGRRVTLEWLGGGRTLSVDRDLTIGSSDRHPYSGVDMYRLVSVPL